MSANDAMGARSDDLVLLLDLIERLVPGAKVYKFVRFQIIVDANIILKDIRYLLTRDTSQDLRTALLEILEVKSIECYAPTYLQVEISEKIPILAGKYGFSISDGMQLWERFAAHISFIDAGGPEDAPAGARDPKDWPYINLQKELEYPIVTNDKDIAGMGGDTAKFTVIGSLQAYARESANALSILVSGGAIVSIPVIVLMKAVAFVSSWVGVNVPKPPRWFWIVAVVLVALLLIYPPSRSWLRNRASKMSSGVQAAFTSLSAVIDPFIDSYESSKTSADEALEGAYAEFLE